MLPRKTALNLCAAAAVLAFALGAQGDSAGFAGNNQEVTPPPEFDSGARVFTLPSLREGAGVGNSNHTTSLPLPLPKGGEINLFPEGRENTGELRDILIRRANGEEFDMREWLAIRRVKLYENAEHAFANALSHRAMQLSFVKRARVDLQTSLGGRKGAGGVDVAGALRETDDDIVGWQLRAYAGEDSAKGLNSGLFYRRIVNGALAGVNVFADYEDGDDGDFWRWSIGGDVKNRFGELSANHYFAITDAQMVGNKKTYTREGYDVDIVARIPRLEWAKARIGYYNFKGEFGDEDETGLRGGLDLSPGKGVVFGVEYDGEDGSFGGNISYTHTFGETQQESQRAGDFNPRAHFYDAVRREYSQRISRTESGGGGLVIVGTGVNVEVKNDAMTATVTATAATINASFPLAGSITVTTSAGNTGIVTMMGGGGAWHLTLSGANAGVAFLNGTVMRVNGGMGSFYRTGAGIGEVVINGVTIILLGTRFDFNADGNITLYEGGLSMAAATGLSIEVADNATVIVNTMTVRCGGTTAMGARANCSFNGMKSVLVTAVVAGANNTQIGAYTLAGNSASDISVSISPATDFRPLLLGDEYQILLLVAGAATPSPTPKVATLHLTDAKGLQQATMVFFTVRVNPQPLAVSYVGGGTPNTAPLTTGGEITVATLTVANGYANGRRAMIVGNGGNFTLTDGTLILTGNNTTARMTAVTIRGVDAHNTDSNSLSITVALDSTPQPLTPVCSGNCRTLTVTAHNVSDLVTTSFTVGSVNWRFLLDGNTLQTRDKVLVSLYDNSGVTFTVTDQQVRGMLGSPSGISVTVINSPSDITTSTGFTVSVLVAGVNYFVGRNQNAQPLAFTVARANIQPSGAVLVTVMNINLFGHLGNNNLVVVRSSYGLAEGSQTGAPTTSRDYVFTLSVNADIESLRGLTVIAPLGAGGTGDSALLELQFSQPQLWQVSYLSNENQPVRLSSFPRRRESPRALGG